jgi:type IV secretion system protein TrbL
MSAPAGSILPDSYFDGLSQFWGATAYVASSLVVAGFVFSAALNRHEPASLLRLLVRVFFVGLATVFIREWLMRLGDIIGAFGDFFGIDPSTVDDKFVRFISGTTPSDPNTSVWDVIWNTGSIGTAIAYSLLWLFGWLAWGVQFIVKLVGDILLSAGWALSPLFLAFFMIRPLQGIALKYVMGLVALVCWPFGWVMAAVVTNAMLERAAIASLIPIVTPGGAAVAPALTVLLIGIWMIISSALAPYVTYRVLTSGVNPAAAFAQGLGGVGQAAFAGGVGAAVAAATGGVAATGVVAAAAAGTLAAGAESTARGGAGARMTSTVVGGISGLNAGNLMRRHANAAERSADAGTRRAAAAESMASEFSQHARRQRQSRSGFDEQPHSSDPNQAAIEIDAYVKS